MQKQLETLESMIGDAGALLGLCPIKAEHKKRNKKSRKSKKDTCEESTFSQWLECLVQKTVIETKEKHGLVND